LIKHLQYKYSDGGRYKSGFRGQTGDCSCCAVANAMGRDYAEVYRDLAEFAKATETRARKRSGKSHPRTGYHHTTMRKYMAAKGWSWVSTMGIGTGCRVHLNADDLPTEGPLLVTVSKHFTAVVDGVVLDSHDPRRNGTRCVYGYFTPPPHSN
jgi:hypothetical protein